MDFLKIINIPKKYKDIIENCYIISSTDKYNNKYLTLNSDKITENELYINNSNYTYRINLLLNNDYVNCYRIPVNIKLKNIINYTETYKNTRYINGEITDESLKDLKKTIKELLKNEKKFKKFILE